MPDLWIQTINSNGAGSAQMLQNYEGLRWSNVNPGGDEVASFTYRAPWFRTNPEIAKGSLLQIGRGLDVLWKGRIEEHDPGAAGSEAIEVTAYGLGARMKDNTMREVYRSGDLSGWGSISAKRRQDMTNSVYTLTEPSVDVDDATGLPALFLKHADVWSTRQPADEAMRDLGSGRVMRSIYYDFIKSADVTVADVNWQWYVGGFTDDTLASGELTANLKAASGSGTFTPVTPRRVVFAAIYYAAASGGASGKEYGVWFRRLFVYGTSLTKRGTEPNAGFFASDLVSDILSRVTGVVGRLIEATTFVIGLMDFPEPTTHEDAITEVDSYQGNDWGTWGPASVLDRSANGYFDYRAKQTGVAHWITSRAELDDADLHNEMSSLYDQVDVTYEDEAGVTRVLRRTRVVPELVAAGMSPRTFPLNAGQRTAAGAAALGDAFLLLSGGYAPARGTAVLKAPIAHYQRGKLGPEYMRADGSNIRIIDVLSSPALIALDNQPDRRSVFPIKHVDVDASGDVITATIDLDQGNTLLSTLQARLALDDSVVGL
jgi:hypothetical protein